MLNLELTFLESYLIYQNGEEQFRTHCRTIEKFGC